jgi:phage terminase large subunit
MIGTISPQIRIQSIYDPLPWQIDPWRDRSPWLLLTGGAGGGKSRLAGEKMHGYCLKYPGATGLITRKAKTSMSGGTILFMRRKIIGQDPNVRWIDSPKFRFEYKNGSIIQFVGLLDDDARDNLKSIGQDGAADIAWMEEATQNDEEDLNAVDARLRGKAAPWRQVILTCNPDAPTHWIYRRLILGGEASVYYSLAADNPHNPDDYADRLGRMTGTDRQRLVEGQWVQATGLVYQAEWRDTDDGGNVTLDAEYAPGVGEYFWALDDGYSGKLDQKTQMYPANAHPRVILFVQVKPDGHIDVFDELYKTETLPEQQIAEALGQHGEPESAVCDSSAATLRRRLNDEDIAARAGTHKVNEGIKHLRGWLAADKNGYRRVRVHPRCRHLRAEMNSYKLKPDTEDPVKAFDHGPDALRYLCWALRYEAE